MKNCVFCKIVKGETKATKVYEDDFCLVFFPKKMEAEGHLLIIPKKHFDNIFDINEKTLEKMINITKKISLKLKKKIGITGINILHSSGKDAQQSIPHFHIHLIPRHKGDGIDAWMKKSNKKNYDKEKLKEKLK